MKLDYTMSPDKALVQVWNSVDVAAAETTLQQIWCWLTFIKPNAGGDICHKKHVATIVSGLMVVKLDNETEVTFVSCETS